MTHRAGFTLIEVLTTITIMVILLTLSVVGLSVYQANARDEERKTDVAQIAQQIEDYYQTDQQITPGTFTNGTYPPTASMNSQSNIVAALPNIDLRALRDPATPTTSSISLIVASNASTPTLASLNSGKTYIYQPLDTNNALCTTIAQECRKFNLYYTLETDLTVKAITSKHQ
jgi:prepilin-type N-terminal cleavage/methylation domain-containing protein